MPIKLAPAAGPPVPLEACLDALSHSGFDPADPGSRDHAAGWLGRLCANRTFLGDLLIDELMQRHRADAPAHGYGPQVLLLRASPAGFILRANVWPDATSPLLRATDPGSFAYGLAHDHNFDFLTCGYFGPGYWSDYYEYDRATVTGWCGEPVPSLRFVERARLAPGSLVHYRAGRDVHVQHAPDALSVSLNLLHCRAEGALGDQYAFDLESRTIARRLGAGPDEAMVRIAAVAGGEAGLDLAERFARHHPSDRMRLSAWEALASVSTEPGAVWQRAEACGNLLVAREARIRQARGSVQTGTSGQSVDRGLQDDRGGR